MSRVNRHYNEARNKSSNIGIRDNTNLVRRKTFRLVPA